jgi:hypothetical protein
MPGGQAHKVNDQFQHEFSRDEVKALKEIAAEHLARQKIEADEAAKAEAEAEVEGDSSADLSAV